MPFDMSSVLHAGRSALLSATRAESKIVVSVGAAGNWYFEWIESLCGRPARHIGVEYYVAPPPVLPPNVEWVANTAAHMPDVATGCADILISGQNIEHLWEDEVAGFLLEAHRILRPGGQLLIDSPNRTITALYGRAHPEHMVELTVDEAVDLLTAAGFDVSRVAGILKCRDSEDGEVWTTENLAKSSPPLVFRIVTGIQDPRNAYLWWIEAIRSERDPDPVRVRDIIRGYWAEGWPERMARMITDVGEPAEAEDGRACWRARAGVSGALAFGPYAPLVPGRYRTTMEVMRLTPPPIDDVLAQLDVFFEGADEAVCHVDLGPDDLRMGRWVPVSLEFEITEMKFGFQTRLFTSGLAELAVVRALVLERV